MELRLYRTDDSVNTINKVLTGERVENIRMKATVNLTTPEILLAGNSDLLNYNYAVIQELGRSYFVENVEVVVNGLYSFQLVLDYLETYKDEILNSHCKFMRKIQQGDYYDGDVDSNVKFDTTTYVSDGGFPEGTSLIMTTVGMTS